MDAAATLVLFAAAGIPVGLATGLALGLVARREAGWGGYGSLSRRAARLGHVAAVMLPALGGLYGLLLGASPHAPSLAAAGGLAWMAGGVLLPAVLFLVAVRGRILLGLVPAALTVFLGAVLIGLSLFFGGAP